VSSGDVARSEIALNKLAGYSFAEITSGIA
jgi:hypothetical protein